MNKHKIILILLLLFLSITMSCTHVVVYSDNNNEDNTNSNSVHNSNNEGNNADEEEEDDYIPPEHTAILNITNHRDNGESIIIMIDNIPITESYNIVRKASDMPWIKQDRSRSFELAEGSYLLFARNEEEMNIGVLEINMTKDKYYEWVVNKNDRTAPFIKFTTPSKDDYDVLLDTEIIIDFSEPMSQTITEEAFHLYDVEKREIDGNFTWSIDKKIMTFIPDTELMPNIGSHEGEHEILVTKNAKDLAGNDLREAYIIKFTTTNKIRFK